MNSDNRTFEEPLQSQAKLNEYKEKEFREYLVNQDVALAVVKFLLSLRNAQTKPDSPSQALIDYFSSQKDQKAWDEHQKLEESVNNLREENSQMEQEIEQIRQAIEQGKLDKARREEEERIRLEEEAKKTSKKPGKK